MDWIFIVFLVSGMLHKFEEYIYPGGFLNILKRIYQTEHRVTVTMAIIVNALFLILCITGIVVAGRNLIFSLSVASLLFYNSLMHIYTTIRLKRYTPGLISALALHLPFSLYAYYLFASAGQLDGRAAGLSAALGALYMVVPVVLLTLARRGTIEKYRGWRFHL